DVCCNGATDGTVTATFSGGTAPYELSLDGSAFAAATSPKTFSGLGAGNHSVAVRDSKGCTIPAQNITILAPPALSLGLGKSDLSCNGAAHGTVTATFSGGTAPYELSLD